MRLLAAVRSLGVRTVIGFLAVPGAVLAQVNELPPAVVVTDTLRLEETDDVINVVYNVIADPSGGFLVADAREGQFRRYSLDGRLLWAFGRAGDGPEEFRAPTTVVRESNHRVILVDRRGKIAVYDETTDSLVSTARAQLSRVLDSAPGPDGLVWLTAAAGLRGDDQQSYAYLVEPTTGRIAKEMFAPPVPEEFRRETLYMNWAAIGADEARQQLWGATATRDTLFLLDPERARIARRIPIESGLLKPMTRISDEAWADVVQRRRWAEEETFLTDVFPLSDGRFAVQFQTFRTGLPVWGFMLIDRDGQPVDEVLDTHRLLTVRDGIFVFQDLNVLDGNQWLVGRIQR
jgi:hypothetical protein